MNHLPFGHLTDTLLSATALGAGLTAEEARAGLAILAEAEAEADAALRAAVVRALTGCTLDDVRDALARRMQDDADAGVRRACAYALLQDPNESRREDAARMLGLGEVEFDDAPEIVPLASTMPPPLLIERLRTAGARFVAVAHSGFDEFLAVGSDALGALRGLHDRMLWQLVRSRDGGIVLPTAGTFGGGTGRRRTRGDRREFSLRAQVFPDDGSPAAPDRIVITVSSGRLEPIPERSPEVVATIEIARVEADRLRGAWLRVLIADQDVDVLEIPVETLDADPLVLELRAPTALRPIDAAVDLEPDVTKIEVFRRVSSAPRA